MYIICEIWASHCLWGSWETSDSTFYRRQNSEAHDWPKVTLRLVKDQVLNPGLMALSDMLCVTDTVCVCVCMCVCVCARACVHRQEVCVQRKRDGHFSLYWLHTFQTVFPSHSSPNSSLHLVLPYTEGRHYDCRPQTGCLQRGGQR